MKYQLIKELSPDSLLMESEEGERVVFDLVSFPVMPRETYRLELQKELQEVAGKEENVLHENLIRYGGLEKYQGEIYLVDKNRGRAGIESFQTGDLGVTCQTLLMILEILQVYHQQGLVLGGLSPGLLKKDREGRFFLQDPLIMSHLSTSLDETYQISPPPEVIAGRGWNQQSDLFSWGLLAYRLLTGVDPFAATKPEDRIDKLAKSELVPPRDLRTTLSEPINQLVIGCLRKKPAQRPSLEILIRRLSEIIASGGIIVTQTEAQSYAVKAEASRKKFQTRENVRVWFRKYGLITLGSLAVVAVLIFTFLGSRTKGVLTFNTKPQEVLGYYFNAIKTLNTTLVDETVYHAKNSFTDMVTNLYVLNRAQQGMTYSMKDYVKMEILDLKIQRLEEDSRHAVYRASYTLKVALPKEIRYFQREDEFSLEPVRKIWRITEIKILREKEWQENLEDSTSGN